MGAKQSSPVFDGRTRAYSSSDLPSVNSDGASDRIAGFRYTNGSGGPRIRFTGGGGAITGVTMPSGGVSGPRGHDASPGGSDGGSPLGTRLLIGSLPAHLSTHMLGGFHCPVCSKYVVSEETEKHLLACFSKTHLAYNKDILSKDSGECAICLEDMEQGDTIARLPCLCIYHKGCIDEWFVVNRSCPEHPSD